MISCTPRGLFSRCSERVKVALGIVSFHDAHLAQPATLPSRQPCPASNFSAAYDCNKRLMLGLIQEKGAVSNI